MAKLATRSREAAKRKAARVDPAQRNVALASGRGAVHRMHPVVENAFPACRTGQQTRRATRYTHTTAPVNCAVCLGQPAHDTVAPTARAARARRNGKAQDEAATQAKEIIAEETAKVIAKRNEPARLKGCSDEDYALAMKVRSLREQGAAWWAIGQQMGLKGAGNSAKSGKTGAAHARRLWEKAWGPTYKDTSVPRETKAIKRERALTQPGKPYFSGDATDLEIIDAVQGREITWLTRLAAGDGVVVSEQKTVVKPGSVRVVTGPKGRVLNFFEMVKDEGSAKLGSGPQRSVYVDRIEKVGL
jgi:hypothetical protein